MERLPEIEEELWRRIQNQDANARIEVFQKYQGLVDVIARNVKAGLPKHAAVEDLCSAGREALWKTIELFSFESNASFSTYATPRIRGAMIDELRRQDELSRRQRKRWQQAQSAYGTQSAFQGTPTVSLDDSEKYDWIVDDSIRSPEDAAVLSDEVSTLNRALIKLPEQQQLILSLVFVEGLSITEAAEVLDLSKSRVSAVYHDALKSLKGALLAARRRPRP